MEQILNAIRKGVNMSICKWTKHVDENVYHTDCGKVQGTMIRPKQKICYCGKQIKRISLDTVSESMAYLQKALPEAKLYK